MCRETQAYRRALHGYDYSPSERAAKEVSMKAAARDFPDVNPVWREWCYDYIVKEVGEAAFARRVDSGHYEREVERKENVVT